VTHRNTFLAAFVLIALPLRAANPTATLLPGTEETCNAQLASGAHYEVHRAILRWWSGGQELFIDAYAYYMPGSGEFLWRGEAISKHGYLRDLKNRPKLSCTTNPEGSIIRLQDGEWVQIWAGNGNIHVTHSTLRFPTIKKAWQYVSEHPEETTSESRRWSEHISVYKELGSDFFRPERLRFEARMYLYNPLVSATKIGSTWRLVLKGADEPNRAEVILDSKFKLLKVTRTAAAK